MISIYAHQLVAITEGRIRRQAARVLDRVRWPLLILCLVASALAAAWLVLDHFFLRGR
jgi:hypothetical protein